MKKFEFQQRMTTIILFLGACGVIGLLVMVSGIVPINASSGHWAITKWVLDFSKSRSVATHSLGIRPPALDDSRLILKGAGHYETGCVQCHGGPGRPASPIALSMTATPPALPPKIEKREPAELFYIVKHGIKFTGMPAWPAQNRDDEVWAMVAFLLELPMMSAEQYRELTGGTIAGRTMTSVEGVSHSTLETCNRCHGIDGLGRGAGAFPRLAGQSREYLAASLHAYADGKRHSGMMQPLAAVLSENQRNTLAEYFAALPVGETPVEADVKSSDEASPAAAEDRAASIKRGRTIAQDGIPDRKVPSCVDCHGPSDSPLAANYPRLAGLSADYLLLQLELFQADQRGGTDSAHLMKPVVGGLAEQDLQDVAAYYESLTPK